MANFNLIRNLCEERKITQKALADKVGLSQQGIISIINSGSTTTDRLEKISTVLDIHPGIFFDGPEAIPENIKKKISNDNLSKLIENMEARIKLLEELNTERLKRIEYLENELKRR